MHTPGPWHAVCEDTINDMPAKFRVDAGGGCVALINTIGPDDASLIAAAPLMLEALRQCEATLYGLGDDYRIDSAWSRARAAIEAATKE